LEDQGLEVAIPCTALTPTPGYSSAVKPGEASSI
jgi:hypothetical protein